MEIVERAATGASIPAIAREMGRGVVTVGDALREIGARYARKRVGELEAQAMAERARSGESCLAIAEALGRRQATVARALRLRGVRVRGAQLRHHEAAEIAALVAPGVSLAALAETVGRNIKTVQRALEMCGVQTSPAHGRKVSGGAPVRRIPHNELRALLAEGLGPRAIAERLGFTVSAIAKRAGVLGLLPPRQPRVRITLRREMLTRFRAGLSVRDISRATGRSSSVVCRHLRAQGVTTEEIHERRREALRALKHRDRSDPPIDHDPSTTRARAPKAPLLPAPHGGRREPRVASSS